MKKLKEKKCTDCKGGYPVGDFYRNVTTRTGYASICKKCAKKRREENREKNNEYSRGWREKNRSYYTDLAAINKRENINKNNIARVRVPKNGWSAEYLEKQLLRQGGPKCANKGCTRLGCVKDHNHTTGKPRGFLCGGCNSALGFSYENYDVIRGLIDYLEEYK